EPRDAEHRGDDEVGADDRLREKQWYQPGRDDASRETDNVESHPGNEGRSERRADSRAHRWATGRGDCYNLPAARCSTTETPRAVGLQDRRSPVADTGEQRGRHTDQHGPFPPRL